jgi:hypothetical protein
VELRQESDEDEERHEFQFINIGNSANLKTDSKARIRAHAMRNYHKRKLKQQASGQEDIPSSPAIPPDITKQTLKFRIGPWGLQQRPVPPRAARQKRPAQSLPIESSAELSAGPPATGGSTRNAPFRKLRPLTPETHMLNTHPPTLHTEGSHLCTQTAKTTNSGTAIVDSCHTALPSSIDACTDLLSEETLEYGPGSGQRDPFNAIPYLASQALQNLLYYCK